MECGSRRFAFLGFLVVLLLAIFLSIFSHSLFTFVSIESATRVGFSLNEEGILFPEVTQYLFLDTDRPIRICTNIKGNREFCLGPDRA